VEFRQVKITAQKKIVGKKNYYSDSLAFMSETVILLYFSERERVYLQISTKRGNLIYCLPSSLSDVI